jgi:octaprenyl-diphosphate synthase
LKDSQTVTTSSFFSSVDALRDAGTADRAGPHVASRLADVVAFFQGDLAWIESALREASGEGCAPATESARHLVEAGGKRVRPLLLLSATACFGAVGAPSRELAVACELVHAATLLHDDVIDDGDERRGRKAARRIWGNAVSVLAGDLLLTHALERTRKNAPPVLLADLIGTLRTLVDGEVVQLRGRTKIDLREATYFQVVRDKTASLFVWAARAGAVLGGAAPAHVDALGEYGARLGIAFQLIDDVLDYDGDQAITGKALLTDLREGKLTLPLLRAIAKSPALANEVDVARGASEGAELAAARLQAAVRASGACAEVRSAARRETEQAQALLATIPASPARDLLGCVARELALRAA